MKKRLCVSCRKPLPKGTYWATCEECQKFWIKYWKLDEWRKKRVKDRRINKNQIYKQGG